MIEKKIRFYLYYLAMFVLSLGASFCFHYLTRTQPSDYLYVEKCVLCAISSFFNLFVLYHHCTHAPHPKFVILPQRRFSIYVHIISGITEFITCWLAFTTGSRIMAKVASLAAICAHVPSASYQTSIVFGSKAVMIASYLLVISLHLFSAVHLFLEPSSVYWLLNMFLIHNIYVWCRVFYVFFGYVGISKDSRYTNAIFTSGLILLPAVLGVSAKMLSLGYIATSILLYLAIVQPDAVERARFVNECTRDLVVNKKVHDAWMKERARLAKLAENDQLTDQQRAKKVFDDLDEDKNGTLDGKEINRLLEEWEVARSFVQGFSKYAKKHPITFEVFYRNIWRLGEISTGLREEGKKRDGRSKARFVFDHLDADGSGYVDALELQRLLIQWGLPENEVEAYLAQDDDKQFSFDEFYHQLKPIWNFAYENMLVSHGESDAHANHHQHSE